ncbi:MAG: tetratricopeptide repeat protein [Anaerobutyricum soehngenii]
MGLFSFESKQVKEWKKLAKSGDMEAQYHLARAYANGKGASINMKRAVDYCVQSAEQEYAPAQALLAHFYGYGKGVEKNYEEMIYWGEKAALQGYAQAQYNVGRCYEQERARNRFWKRQCIGIC